MLRLVLRVAFGPVHGLVDLGRLPPPGGRFEKTLSSSGIDGPFGSLFVMERSFETPTDAMTPLDHASTRWNEYKTVAFILGATMAK